MKHLIVLFSLAISVRCAQFFFPSSLDAALRQPLNYYDPLVSPQQHLQPLVTRAAELPRHQYAHPSVIENSLREAQLPADQLKSSHFYNNPQTAAALAKESWFTNLEMPVLDREAEKIPRDMIYKLIKNAGFIKRR